MTRVDSLVPLMYNDRSDLGSQILIQIILKEQTFKLIIQETKNNVNDVIRGGMDILCKDIKYTQIKLYTYMSLYHVKLQFHTYPEFIKFITDLVSASKLT